MSGLKNTVKRSGRWLVGKGYKTRKEARSEKDAKKQSALDKVYSDALMPDEEEIERDAKRKAARRRGSRVSTVLTEDKDTLG